MFCANLSVRVSVNVHVHVHVDDHFQFTTIAQSHICFCAKTRKASNLLIKCNCGQISFDTLECCSGEKNASNKEITMR